jgi:excinuclease ABC subunit C
MSSAIDNPKLEYLLGIVRNLPESPGCYQYLDDTGKIIYVGKAKNLRNRVSSYFNRDSQQTYKTSLLVRKIRDIKYIVVNTETDALLLENNLIKKHKPHYNILLKDDKTYPSIVVTNEYFPRIFKTRHIVKGAGTYFGPYSHVPTLNALLDLIKQLYPLRTCRTVLSEEGIRAKKYEPCLEYHIKNCKAPCIAKQSREEYMENIREAMEILRGNTGDLERKLQQEMAHLAEEMRFEEAQQIKERYTLLREYKNRSEVVSSVIHNVDVFAIETEEKAAYVNFLHVTEGCITQAYTFEYRKRLDESDADLLVAGILDMRERYKSESREVIVPFEVELPWENVSVTVPQKGEKRKLLGLSLLNVKQYKADRMKQADKLNPEQRSVRLLKQIQEELHLPNLPMHIECFDNSNISGTDAVAACVVFKGGKPEKKEYRKFNIKTVEGPDDYASMREVVYRRYHRLKEEGSPLPDLIITDGGKGQMEVVREVVEDALHLNIPIAGLAKDNKHRTNELLYGFPPAVIGVKLDSPLFHLLTRIQDEVHRFAITFHKDKRSKRQIASELDTIKGIGPTTKTALLTHFKSVKRIREASFEEVVSVVGQAKAKILTEHWKNEG